MEIMKMKRTIKAPSERIDKASLPYRGGMVAVKKYTRATKVELAFCDDYYQSMEWHTTVNGIFFCIYTDYRGHITSIEHDEIPEQFSWMNRIYA